MMISYFINIFYFIVTGSKHAYTGKTSFPHGIFCGIVHIYKERKLYRDKCFYAEDMLPEIPQSVS